MRASGQASGPVLTSRFQEVLNHSANVQVNDVQPTDELHTVSPLKKCWDLIVLRFFLKPSKILLKNMASKLDFSYLLGNSFWTGSLFRKNIGFGFSSLFEICDSFVFSRFFRQRS